MKRCITKTFVLLTHPRSSCMRPHLRHWQSHLKRDFELTWSKEKIDGFRRCRFPKINQRGWNGDTSSNPVSFDPQVWGIWIWNYSDSSRHIPWLQIEPRDDIRFRHTCKAREPLAHRSLRRRTHMQSASEFCLHIHRCSLSSLLECMNFLGCISRALWDSNKMLGKQSV